MEDLQQFTFSVQQYQYMQHMAMPSRQGRLALHGRTRWASGQVATILRDAGNLDIEIANGQAWLHSPEEKLGKCVNM
jgi:hypothetical protein